MQKDLNSLSGTEFEELCAALIVDLGFQIEMTKTSGDGGIDIIANSNLPLIKGKYIIQCKRYSGTVGEPILRDLYGVVTSERANKGILMTTGTFTRNAIAFAEGKPLELIDIYGIQALISKSGYKIPGQMSAIDVKKIESILENGLEVYKFSDLLSELELNPNNLRIRGKLGALLFNEATDSLNFSCYSLTDRRSLLCGCLYYLKNFERHIEKCEDKTLKLQSFISLWCCAQSSFLLGKYKEAERYYQMILVYDDLLLSVRKDNNLLECLYSVIVDLISFYATTKQVDQAQSLLQHQVYSSIIKRKRDLLQQSISCAPDIYRSRYWKSLVDDLDNILTHPNFHLLCLDETKLFDSYSLYDKMTKCYDTGSILNLLSPTLCSIETEKDKIRLTVDNEVLMVIPSRHTSCRASASRYRLSELPSQ